MKTTIYRVKGPTLHHPAAVLNRLLPFSSTVFSSHSLCPIPPLNEIPYYYTVEVRNRFKGLDLIDRVPEEVWMEVRDIVQEAGIKTIPKKKKCKKAKLSEEPLQIV